MILKENCNAQDTKGVANVHALHAMYLLRNCKNGKIIPRFYLAASVCEGKFAEIN